MSATFFDDEPETVQRLAQMYDLKPGDIKALRRVARGTATPGQQQTAMLCVISNICRAHTLVLFEENDRKQAFTAGCLHVGTVLSTLTQLSLTLPDPPDDHRHSDDDTDSNDPAS